MHRVFRRLHHEQLLSTAAVIIAAIITFILLALLSGSDRQSVERGLILNDLQSDIYQLGSVHQGIISGQSVNDSNILVFELARQNVRSDLSTFRSEFGDSPTYRDLEGHFMAYADNIENWIAGIQNGSLSTDDPAQKQLLARSILELGGSLSATREYVSRETSASYRQTRLGYAGAIIFLVVAVLVITRLTERRLRRALLDEERLRAEHERSTQFEALIQNISDSILMLDTRGRVRYATPMSCHTVGPRFETLIGTPITGAVHPADRSILEEMIDTLVKRGPSDAPMTCVVRIQSENRGWAWIEAVATNRTDVPGVEGIVINARDVSERRKTEEQLRFLARHDSLTGLANRAELTEHVTKTINRDRRDTSSFAVLFIDLDDFKHVNDSWGHNVGDELLIAVAGRLVSVLRPGDFAARLGGDEFVLVIDDIPNVGDARTIGDRVHAALDQPLRAGGHSIQMAASIGIFIASNDRSVTASDILRFADVAMYRAKHAGRNRTAVYLPGDMSHTHGRTKPSAHEEREQRVARPAG